MKQFFKKFVVIVLSLLTALSALACNPEEKEWFEEEVDPSRTQLYVFNYNGGYGSDWLRSVKQRFETLYENTELESGKKGVQVMVNPQKTKASGIAADVLDGRDEVYFVEYAFYYDLKSQGILGDITEAVTTELPGEEKTIYDKMTEQQRAYYGVAETDGTHYYAIPHYAGYNGLIYNVDLFDDKGYYFIDEPTGTRLEDYFIYYPDDVKSAGPDGEKGNYDDGLPATYEEFFILCEYIAQGGDIPVLWNGDSASEYIDGLCKSLAIDYEGLSQASLNFTLEGTATSLGTASGSQFVADETSSQVSTTDAYKLSRQAGKYYALKFVEKLINAEGGKYHNDNAFKTSYTHIDAQDDFLLGGQDGETKSAAMLVEGIWWQNEAAQTFLDMQSSIGEEMSKKNRNFAFMPLPKANENASAGVTLYDHILSMCFMKGNLTGVKRDLAIDFIKFVNTDESLIEFTQTTDTPKALNYTMTSTQKSELSPFGRSVIDMKERANVVYPMSTTAKFLNNQSSHLAFFSSKVGDSEKQYCALSFWEDKVSPETYFNGLYQYKQSIWSTLN